MRYIYFCLVFLLLFIFETKAQKPIVLNTVTVSGIRKVDTVFGTWKFSVADFEFYEDKLILLTYRKSLTHASVMLTDASQKLLSVAELPDEAQKLYKDYMGFVNVICQDHIYRIIIRNDSVHLGSLPVDLYRSSVMPCIDTIEKDIYFSNYDKDYPEFTYYSYNTVDCTLSPFKTVCDKEALQGFNMEYYFLKPKDRVEANKLASYYGVDKHKIAAAMRGLTTSMFYTPLYAPLYIVNDTVCIFDHYSDAILKYDKKHHLLDSVQIDYNHPKSWKEWKHRVIMDKKTNRAYALYQKNGFYYLKHIDLYSGKITGSFKLTNQYVDKIKIRGDYVYYVYRPFESQQELFVYKELITN